MLVIVYNDYMKIIMLSVKDAAKELGISDSHCRRLLETGKIKGEKLGRDWVVRELKYRRKRGPGGGRNPAGMI